MHHEGRSGPTTATVSRRRLANAAHVWVLPVVAVSAMHAVAATIFEAKRGCAGTAFASLALGGGCSIDDRQSRPSPPVACRNHTGACRRRGGGIARPRSNHPAADPVSNSPRLFATIDHDAEGSGAGEAARPRSRSDDDDDDANQSTPTMMRTARSLLGVVSHIQNPELYSADWADGARVAAAEASKAPGGDAAPPLVCARDGGAEPGDVLSLYPIHAFGIRGAEDGTEGQDLVLYDVDRDGNFFGRDDSKKAGGFVGGGGGGSRKKARKGKKGRRQEQSNREKRRRSTALRLDIAPPLLEYDAVIRELFCATDLEGDSASPVQESLSSSRLFVDVNPSRQSLPGWLGHRARSASASLLDDSKDTDGNCIVLSLPGAAPLCALVATRHIDLGEELVLYRQGALAVEELEALARSTREKYESEVLELGSYVAMAAAPPKEESATGDGETGVDEATSLPKAAPAFQRPFHAIDLSYPGIRTLCSSPAIYAVDDFLTESECDRLIDKARPYLFSCLTKDPSTGEVKVDKRRTSTNANIPQAEAPTIVRKLMELTGLQKLGREEESKRLETLQILRYAAGDQFMEHTDGFDGPASACGFENSGRLVTVFVYLNDVPRGGTTAFPEAGVDVVPKKGMAVVHFPSTLGFEDDERTLHAGRPAVDEKWLLTTWLWGAPRSVKEYAEEELAPLSSDLI